MSVTVEINDSEVTSMLRRIGKAGVDARPLAAQAAARCTQDHFRTLDKSRHRAGSGTRSFYGTAAEATTGRVQGDNIVVSIDALGLALRRYGGTVTPKRTKYLAIPDEDNATAIQNSPRRVPGLHFRRNASGNGGRLTDNTGRVFYWLVKKSVHKANPSVIPTDDDFEKAIVPRLQAKLDRM